MNASKEHLMIILFFNHFYKAKPDWKLLKDHLSKEGRIEKEDLVRLVADCNKIMSNIIKFAICIFLFYFDYNLILIVFKGNENNLLTLQDPLTVVGDIHGYLHTNNLKDAILNIKDTLLDN